MCYGQALGATRSAGTGQAQLVFVTDYVRMTVSQRYLGSGKGAAQSRAAWPDEMFNEEIYLWCR